MIINRNLTVNNLRWNHTIINFKYQKEAIEKRAEMTVDPPKLSKNFSIMKWWSKATSNHLSLMIGLWMIPLSFLVRKKEEKDHVDDSKPHSAKCGSVESGMIHLAFHDHLWCLEDNSKVCHILEESTRGTMHVSSIKPFQKKKYGRASFMSIMLQHDGPDKWTALLQACDSHLHTGKWKINNSFPLSEHVSKHLQSYV